MKSIRSNVIEIARMTRENVEGCDYYSQESKNAQISKYVRHTIHKNINGPLFIDLHVRVKTNICVVLMKYSK